MANSATVLYSEMRRFDGRASRVKKCKSSEIAL